LGAGTVLSADQAKAAVDAGAQFIVSPGFNDEVVGWCIKNDVAVTPGCVTPTEIEHALSFGLNVLKFFPASIYGGIKGCKALYGPYRMVKFIPTGGVNLNTLAEYADKNYIHAIGGGWLCSSKDISNKDYESIKKTVKASIDILLGFELEKAEGMSEVKTNNIERAAFYLESKGGAGKIRLTLK
jgi:2-dehydro-3-deoxyphosphogluconate aldolase/(4S)-4-hydroxy-2-oxoglutarate aldolase